MKSGVVIINKEAGWTSFDVVAKLRRILGIKKIGHTGTLDPDATGVLVVCIGKATKLVEELTHVDKIYRAGLLLGLETDTQDISGEVVRESSDYPDIETLGSVIKSFIGKTKQIPPMYSAKKIGGKKLYELARKGEIIERKPVPIEIYDIETVHPGIPKSILTISCSSGTYIRTLCHDIGKKLGCGACMESLARLKVGDFSIDEAFSIREIEESAANDDFSFITPIDAFFGELPGSECKKEAVKLIENGNSFSTDFLCESQNGKFRLYHPDKRFVGIYEAKNGICKPEKFFLE